MKKLSKPILGAVFVLLLIAAAKKECEALLARSLFEIRSVEQALETSRWRINMIRTSIKCAAAAVGIGLLTACYVPEKLDSPPDLQAETSSGGTSIEVPTRLTTYSWGGEMTYGGPEEAFKSEKGALVAAGAEIRLSFDGEEPDELTVRHIDNSPPPAEMKSTNGRFTVHEQPGTYVYGIYGDWPEGSALYGIKVTVE